MRVIASIEELRGLVEQEVAVTDWFCIAKGQVNLFAEATGDRQWIHLDLERCQRESPYGEPVAHGFLTLSLLPVMMNSAVYMPLWKMTINYGLNRVRFPAPVPVGSQVRGRMTLLDVEDIEGGAQITWKVTIECEDSDKPVCVAEFLTRHYR